MATNTQLAQILRERASRLELQVATTRLLTNLFREGSGTDKTPGRYHFLEKVIEQDPKLLQALLNGKAEAIELQWSQALRQHHFDVSLLHGLAVAYWECALASLTKQEDAERYWVVSTTLWALLLSTKAFWDYFSRARRTDDKGERVSLKDEEQGKLLQEVQKDILSLHSTYGKRYFAEAEAHSAKRNFTVAEHYYKQAQVHLRCLYLCQSGDKTLIEALRKHGVDWHLSLDNDRLEKLTEEANRLLDEWCALLVGEAEKVANDAEAIKRLPQGIRENYEGGIRRLEPFIKLNIPVVRMLSKSLEWYNDWCYDLYITKDIKLIKELIQPARVVADRLIPLCTQKHWHKPENQALSQHFLLRGFTADDPELSAEEYKKALSWNATNANAEKLLGDSYQEILMSQVKEAIDCIDRRQFKEAYQRMAVVEQKATDKELVRQGRAAVYFRHANVLVGDGKFRGALDRAREALKLEPTQEAIRELVTTLEELAVEEDNIQHLKSAQKAFEGDRYDEALNSASRVSRQSRFYNQARHLQSGAYFHRGIQAAKQERFTEAVADLQHALELNDNKEERKIIAGQLETVEQARIGFEVKEAMEANDLPRIEQVLRNILARETSRKGRHQIQSQLSLILNARGVASVNEIKELEKPFGEALVRIVSLVKEVLSISHYGASTSGLKGNSSCAVCDKNQAQGVGWASNYGKGRVVLTVVEAVQSSGGKFSISSLTGFWINFLLDLCSSCGSKLVSIDAKKNEAQALLEEAVRLDSSNKTARTNLAALKNMM